MKECLICKNLYSKTPKETYKHYEIRKYCSLNCYHIADKGSRKKVNPISLRNLIHGFVKGFTPWNKGNNSHPNCLGCNRKCRDFRSTYCKACFKGKNSPHWKGGITPLNLKIRNSKEYKEWRENVFRRDNYTCIQCGDNRGGNLEAHHIVPFCKIYRIKSLQYLLWDINNGHTLCRECHKKTPTWSGRARNYEYIPNTNV